MELIKVIFFAFGSFFGLQNSKIISETTNVTVNLEKQVVNITHNNLITFIRHADDSIKVSNELYRIVNPAAKENRLDWRKEFDAFEYSTFNITDDEDSKQLNAKIELKYTNKKQLEELSIEYIAEKKAYVLINIKEWNIKTTTGKLQGNYWYFKDKISFTMTPLENIPQNYKAYKKSLYPYWQKVKPQ